MAWCLKFDDMDCVGFPGERLRAQGPGVLEKSVSKQMDDSIPDETGDGAESEKDRKSQKE